MRLLLIYTASIALGLLASPSRAAESFHCPEPGTILSFTEGTVLTFTTQDSLTCRARSNKGALLAQFLGIAPAESRLRRPPEPSTLSWWSKRKPALAFSGQSASIDTFRRPD